LDLVVGEQSVLLAAKGLASENPVKLVARVVKQNRGDDFLPSCKFAYDPTNGTVYVMVDKESDAFLMALVASVSSCSLRTCTFILFFSPPVYDILL
jgi:hypothetical protein